MTAVWLSIQLPCYGANIVKPMTSMTAIMALVNNAMAYRQRIAYERSICSVVAYVAYVWQQYQAYQQRM